MDKRRMALELVKLAKTITAGYGPGIKKGDVEVFPKSVRVHITLPEDIESYDWGTLSKTYADALKAVVKKATGKDFHTTAASSEGNVLHINQRGVGGGWSDETAQAVMRAMQQVKPPKTASTILARINKGKKYGDWVVMSYVPVTVDEWGGYEGGTIKLVNQRTMETVIVQHDYALRSPKWWASYAGRQIEDKSPEKVIQVIVKKTALTAAKDAEPMVEISRGGQVEGAMTADEFRKALGLTNRVSLQDAVKKYNDSKNGDAVAEIVWTTKSKGKRVKLFKGRQATNDEQLAARIVKLAKTLVAGVQKGDMVEIDLAKAKATMDSGEYGALEIYAKKSGGVGIAEVFNQRKGTWIISIEGARGGFDVPEDALTPTGKQDPDMYTKQLRNLVQVLPINGRFDSIEYFGNNMSFSISTTVSAPPLTTKDVANVEARLEDSVEKFKKFVSGLMKSKVSANPYVHMAAASGKILFRKDVQLTVDKKEVKKLETLAGYMTSNPKG